VKVVTAPILARWLKRRPAESVALQLLAADDESIVQVWDQHYLQDEWPRDGSEPLTLAQDIVQHTVDACDMAGVPLRFIVRWLVPAQDGKTAHFELVIKQVPTPEGKEADGLDFDEGADTADMRGMAGAGLRHIGNMHKMYFAALRDVQRSLRDINSDLRQALGEANSENRYLRARLKRVDMKETEDNEGARLLEADATATAIEKVGSAIAEAIPTVARAYGQAKEDESNRTH
jgi:hypothetical protein